MANNKWNHKGFNPAQGKLRGKEDVGFAYKMPPPYHRAEDYEESKGLGNSGRMDY